MFPQGSSFTTRPQLAGTFGMVASTHWLASAAGMAVLEADGTAFDAAVAVGLVLQVVEPHMNGLGGEVPVIGYAAGAGSGAGGSAPDGEVFVLNGQGPAGGSATAAAFREMGLDLIPGNGLLPACVPAAFGTWLLLLQRYGRLPLRAVMQYAIGYARDGYPMTAGASAAIASAEQLFRQHWASSAEVYLAAAGCPRPGPGSPTRRWPRPTSGSWTRPRPRDRTGMPRSTRPARPTTRASWPKPSTATWPGPR